MPACWRVGARSPDLARDAEVLRSVPGIGPVTPATLLARLPELGQLDRRAIASMAGLAPKARERGKLRGKRRIGQGGSDRADRTGPRERPAPALQGRPVALAAARRQWAAAPEARSGAGKPPKVALIALTRKIAPIANAVLRGKKPFQAAQEP